MNIRSILNSSTKELQKAGIKSAGLDVQVLLQSVLDKSDAYLFAHPEAPLSNSEYQKFRRFVRRRKKGEPIAYILSEKEFYGLKFKVNKNVLIPRPESELIVEETLSCIKYLVSRIKQKQLNIIDVGTGSGCIITALAKTMIFDTKYAIQFYATDISPTALRVAKLNSKINGVADRIKFYQTDLLSNPRLLKQLDVVIANLPYIPQDKKYQDIDYTTLSYEPKLALFGGPKGYELIEKLIVQISKRTYQPKVIILEVFEDYIKELKLIAKNNLPNYNFELKKDLAGLNRFIVLTKAS